MTLHSTYYLLPTFFKNRPWAGVVFVFSLSLLFSRWFWPTLSFADPDSFYHIYLAQQLPHGLTRDFPWLPFTSLADAYTDHHFLYHVFLAPFVIFLNSFVGAWAATVLLAAFVHTLFYATLRILRFRAPLFFTLLLFSASAFEFRMHLAKAPAVSLIFVLLGICFLARKRLIALGILAFLFVWSHGSWPLLLIIAFMWCAVDFFMHTPVISSKVERSHFKRVFWSPFILVAVGSLLGLIINPYFPQNIPFYWRQIMEIAVVNFGTTISVGEEWYASGSGDLVRTHAMLVLLGIGAIIMFIVHARGVSRGHFPLDRPAVHASLRAILLATIIAIITLKSRRHVDYFAPFLIMAIASLATLSGETVLNASSHIRLFFKERTWFPRLIITPCIVIVISIGVLTGLLLVAHRRALIDGYPPEQFAAVGQWLRDYAEPGSIVFHTEWDDFPFFMYQAPHLRYINGLDPTFFYRHDSGRYELWNTLIRGEYAGNVIEPIVSKFDARYIAITLPPRFELFKRQVSLSDRVREVYRDATVVLFEIL